MIDDDEYDSNGQVSGSQSVKSLASKSHFLPTVSIKIGFLLLNLLHSSYNFIIHYK